MKAVLSIAGSDSSGGAGIQADIKTIAAHGLFAETVITAVTAQNTLGVTGVQDIDPDMIAKQLDAVFDDIVPNAVKVGMVSSIEAVEVIAEKLRAYGAKHIVVDPVMVATTGAKLIADGAVDAVITKLLPLAQVVTPNIPEAEVLCGMKIESQEDMLAAGWKIAEACNGAVLIKGGHRREDANDLLITEHGREVWLCHKRVETSSTHGTGCTLSSAIACNLASGFETQASVQKAKNYITGALMHDPGLGRGNGPLDHMWDRR